MIRLAKVGDRESVLALARQFAVSFKVEDGAFELSWNELIVRPDACLFVAEESNRIAAYLLGFRHPTFYANGPVGWVEEVMVEETRRWQGLGSELMRQFEIWAEDGGCRLVALATRRASGFYQALGYEESATYFRKLL